MKKIKYQINEIKKLNDKLSEIILLPLPHENQLKFLPGQYAYIYFDSDTLVPYSIASSPSSNKLKFLIYNGKNNSSRNFFLENRNNQIFISEAQGNAYYRNNGSSEILLISKGLGLSPIISMLEHISEQPINTQPKISLFNVVSSSDDLIFNDYFEIKSKKIKFSYINFVTNGTYNLDFLYKKLDLMQDSLRFCDFYVFGSQLFVLDIYKELLPYCKNNFYSDVNIDLSKAGI